MKRRKVRGKGVPEGQQKWGYKEEGKRDRVSRD
jgi:hypothetical protein